MVIECFSVLGQECTCMPKINLCMSSDIVKRCDNADHLALKSLGLLMIIWWMQNLDMCMVLLNANCLGSSYVVYMDPHYSVHLNKIVDVVCVVWSKTLHIIISYILVCPVSN